MKLKIAIILPTVLLALGGSILFGIYLQQENAAQKEAQVACIATAFPAVMIERNRISIQNLLDDLQQGSHENERASSEPVFVFSKEIDQRFVELAGEIEVKSTTPMSLRKPETTEKFTPLIELFQEDASHYLGECVPLFRKIRDRCGSLQKAARGSESCLNRYQADISQIVDKHVSVN